MIFYETMKYLRPLFVDNAVIETQLISVELITLAKIEKEEIKLENESYTI